MEPEELDAWGFITRKKPAEPAPEDLTKRFRDVTDAIDEKLNKFQASLELMVRLLDERLTSFEARLPALKKVETGRPLYTLPP